MWLIVFDNDIPEPWELGFHDAGCLAMEEIIFFHDEIMYFVVLITILVLWGIIRALISGYYHKYLFEGVLIEVIWTLLPAVVLIFLAFPSLKLLYLMDDVISPGLTIKIVGHQWYWFYEYSDYGPETIEFDSYLIPTSSLNEGEQRLLDVDNRMKAPVHTEVRLLVTGEDVLHSFAVTSLSIKVDAVPGRLNQASFMIKREGLFYGQCSEICGANHSFMPIVVEGVSLSNFISWVENYNPPETI